MLSLFLILVVCIERSQQLLHPGRGFGLERGGMGWCWCFGRCKHLKCYTAAFHIAHLFDITFVLLTFFGVLGLCFQVVYRKLVRGTVQCSKEVHIKGYRNCFGVDRYGHIA